MQARAARPQGRREGQRRARHHSRQRENPGKHVPGAGLACNLTLESSYHEAGCMSASVTPAGVTKPLKGAPGPPGKMAEPRAVWPPVTAASPPPWADNGHCWGPPRSSGTAVRQQGTHREGHLETGRRRGAADRAGPHRERRPRKGREVAAVGGPAEERGLQGRGETSPWRWL